MFRKLEIEAFSPIFIASGDVLLEPFEILIDVENSAIYYDFENELRNALDVNLLRDIISHLNNGNYAPPYSWIKNKVRKIIGEGKAKQAKFYYYSPEDVRSKILHAHVKTRGKLYIPASTLKGTINTAFGINAPKGKTRNRDPLLIRDSSLIDRRVFCEEKNIKINPSKSTKNISTGILEMIDEGEKIEFSLSFNPHYENYYQTTDLEKIMERVDSYTRTMVKVNLKTLKASKLNPPEKQSVIEVLESFLEIKDGYLMIIGRDTEAFYKIFPVEKALRRFVNKKSLDVVYYKDDYVKPGLCVARFKD